MAGLPVWLLWSLAVADSVPSLSPFGLTQHQLDHLDLVTQKYLEFVRPTFSWTLRSRQGDEVT